MKGKIFSINISIKKGTPKSQVLKANLVEGLGIEGDAHAGFKNREVSLLSIERIKEQETCPKVQKKGLTFNPGDFAENITTQGLDLSLLKIGDKIKINNDILLEVSQIGKECHNYCEIFKKMGDCIMPKEGIFTRVLKGGEIKVGDEIEVLK